MADPIKQTNAQPSESVGDILNSPFGQSIEKLIKGSSNYQQTNKNLMDATVNLATESAVLQEKGSLYQKEQSEEYLKKVNKEYDDVKEKTTKLRSQQNWEYPEFHPTQDNMMTLATIFSLVGVLGGMMGGGGRNASMNALGAMTGMMDGWSKGEKNRFALEKSAFDESLKSMQARNEGLQKQIENLVNQYTNDRAHWKENYDVFLANNPYLKRIDSLKGFAGVIDQANKINEGNLKLAEIRERQAERISREKDRQLEKVSPFVRGEIEKSYPNYEVRKILGLSPKDSERVEGALTSIKETENVANFIKQKPEAVGALSKIRNLINLDAIKSITGDSPEDVAKKSSIIDGQINNAVKTGRITSDEAESAKLLQKQLFALALADVKASGQRGSIYLDKQFQNIYDQSSRLDTLTKILHDRERAANEILKPIDLDFDKRSDKKDYELITTGADSWLNKNFPVYTQQQYVEARKSGKLKEGDIYMGVDGIPRRVPIARRGQ